MSHFLPCKAGASHVFCNLQMSAQQRRLRARSIQEDLKAWYECHLLQGLNGHLISVWEQPDLDAVLPRDANAIKRVKTLLEALQSAAHPGIRGMLHLDFPDQAEFIEGANSGLRRYVQFPVIFVDPFSRRITSKMEHRGGDEWENGAVEAILSLLKDGQLSRLKQCRCCGNWLYSLRTDQWFCSTACRQKNHSQSGEFKEKRKDYMRTYRESGNEKRAKSRASNRGNRKGRK